MKGFIVGVVVTLLVLTAGVFTVSHFGLYPIGADNPPTSLERSLAGRAMDEYADKHKPDMQNPTQINAANLTEGAKEYEEHCAFCHGGAKAKISPMRDKFNPPAPQLINRIPHDPDNWLFWVTKHGVRMTGMPTWDGIMSDEEIWKVVAFIKNSNKLPPETAAAWQNLASEPTEINEHTPEQHHDSSKDDPVKKSPVSPTVGSIAPIGWHSRSTSTVNGPSPGIQQARGNRPLASPRMLPKIST